LPLQFKALPLLFNKKTATLFFVEFKEKVSKRHFIQRQTILPLQFFYTKREINKGIDKSQSLVLAHHKRLERSEKSDGIAIVRKAQSRPYFNNSLW